MQRLLSSRRDFLKTTALGGCALAIPSLVPRVLGADSIKPLLSPACGRIPGTKFQLQGRVQEYLTGVTAQWLRAAPASNPAMLEMFRDRDRRPLRDMVPWAGEFAGKHLVSAVQVWRVTGDEALKQDIADFVKRLVALQADDGYLGPWPK